MTGWRLRVTALYSAPFLPYCLAPRIDNLRVLTFSNLTHCDKDKFVARKRSGFVCNFSRIFVTPSAVPRVDQKFSTIDEDFKAKEKRVFCTGRIIASNLLQAGSLSINDLVTNR